MEDEIGYGAAWSVDQTHPGSLKDFVPWEMARFKFGTMSPGYPTSYPLWKSGVALSWPYFKFWATSKPIGWMHRVNKKTPLILATSHPQGDSLRVGNGKPGALAHRRAQAFFRCGHGWWEMDGDHFGWGRKPRGQLRLRASEPCWLWDTDEGLWEKGKLLRNVEKGYSEWLWMQWFLDDGFC